MAEKRELSFFSFFSSFCVVPMKELLRQRSRSVRGRGGEVPGMVIDERIGREVFKGRLLAVS